MQMTYPTKYRRILILATLPFFFAFAGLTNAKCLPDDSFSECRYPQGDAWCAAHEGGNLYAYSDQCLESSGEIAGALPMDRVYQGIIRLPDFAGRDRPYSNYRTRITNEMETGPNFAGHYAIVVIGCGTGCRFALVGDVATGEVFDFPYGGEEFYSLNLRYSVKSNRLSARWIDGDDCLQDLLEWTGREFISKGKDVIGTQKECYVM